MPRVLILEDDAPLRNVIAEYLQARGYAVHISEGIEDALQHIATRTVEVAVIDLFLPGGDGLDVIEQAKIAVPETKLVAISGGSKIQSDVCLRCARQVGADASLTKPFSLFELEIAIESLIRSSD